MYCDLYHANMNFWTSCLRYRRLYNKKSKRWCVYALKTNKDYMYIPELQRSIVRKRIDSATGLSKRRPLKADDPRALGNLPDVPPPPTAELVQAQLHRGDVSMTELAYINCLKFVCCIGPIFTLWMLSFFQDLAWSTHSFNHLLKHKVFKVNMTKDINVYYVISFFWGLYKYIFYLLPWINISLYRCQCTFCY